MRGVYLALREPWGCGLGRSSERCWHLCDPLPAGCKPGPGPAPLLLPLRVLCLVNFVPVGRDDCLVGAHGNGKFRKLCVRCERHRGAVYVVYFGRRWHAGVHDTGLWVTLASLGTLAALSSMIWGRLTLYFLVCYFYFLNQVDFFFKWMYPPPSQIPGGKQMSKQLEIFQNYPKYTNPTKLCKLWNKSHGSVCSLTAWKWPALSSRWKLKTWHHSHYFGYAVLILWQNLGIKLGIKETGLECQEFMLWDEERCFTVIK